MRTKRKVIAIVDLSGIVIGVLLVILFGLYQLSFSQTTTFLKKEIYKEKTLDISTALDVAMKNNPNLKITQARIGQAEEQLKGVRSIIYPTLTLDAGYERIEETASLGLGRFRSSNTNIATGQIEARYLISLRGGRKAAIEQAREEVRAVALDKKQVQKLLSHQVRSAYYSILLTRETTDIARQSLQFARLQMDQAKARLEAGVGLKTDLLTFSVMVLENQIRLQEAQNASRLAIAALAELLAVEIREDITLSFPELSVDPLENLSKEVLIQKAFNNRPELKALERRIAAAREAVTVKKASTWPRVEVFANYGFTKESNLKLTGEDDEARIGVTMSMNLFDGGAKRSKVQRSLKRVNELKAGLTRARLGVSRLVEDILNNISEAKNRLETSRETILLAEENLNLRAVRYEAGVGTILEVTEGEVQLSQARLTELQAKIDLLIARSRLKEVLG